MEIDKKTEDQINAALSREPDFQLEPGFPDRIIAMIEAVDRKERRWEIFWFAMAGFLFLIGLIVVFALTDFNPTLSGLSFLSNNLGLIGFGITFIILLHILDKKLIHKAGDQLTA